MARKNKAVKPLLLPPPINWLWLLVGAVAVPFIPAQTPIALAAWIAPIFLLRFSRTTHPLIAIPSIMLVFFVGSLIAYRNGFLPGEPADSYVLIAGIAIAYTILFILDKVLARYFTGLLRTLIFPTASVALGYLATIGNLLGTGGSEAYSQSAVWIIQLASLTGIWGIVFLMYWFASVVNHLWEHNFSVTRSKVPVYSFIIVALLAGLYSGLKLTLLASTENDTVMAAGIAPTKTLNEQTLIGDLDTPEQVQQARQQTQLLEDYFFERTEQEAWSGAKIIAWSEASAKILKDDEPTFIKRAKEVADRYDIYLQVGLSTFKPAEPNDITENRAIMFTPQGELAWDYHKAKVTPGDTETPGPAEIPTIETPYGTIATIICQDDLFPEYIAQAGRKKVDILLIPSSDWDPIAEFHNNVTRFRAVENGVNILRPTRKGISTVVDVKGQVVQRVDGFDQNAEQVIRAELPTRRVPTMYPYVGDTVAYLSVAVLGAFMGIGLYKMIKNRQSKK